MPNLMEALGEVLLHYSDLPVAFFGHSMGALIAAEAARLVEPQHLFVSACPAPQVDGGTARLHELPEPEFRDAVGQWNGIPEVIRADSGMMDVFSPVLRADLQLFETYRPTSTLKFSCPVTAFAGDADHTVSRDTVEAWGETSREFRLHTLPGDHFFLRSSGEVLLDLIGKQLAAEA